MNKSSAAAARFFVRIGQAGRANEIKDTFTRPLFPLPLILAADGTLAPDAQHLVSDDAAYLRRCHKLIRSINLDLSA